MKHHRNTARTMIAAAITGLVTIGLGFPATAALGSEPDLLDLVESANPALIGALSNEQLENGALDGDFGRLRVTVYDSASAGIVIAKEDGSVLALSLPFAETAAVGRSAGDGTVSFDNRNGSATVVSVTADGSVAVHSVIDGAQAPVEYSYSLKVPEGATIEQVETGEVLILDADGASLFFVAAPWAVDAEGADVPTRYEVRGDMLVQVVDHAGFAYPVVADPSIGGFYMSSYSWTVPYTQLKIWPTFAGGTFNPALVYSFGWPEVVGAPGIGSGRVNASMQQQFLCHCYGNTLLWVSGQSWDLENWRGTVSDPIAMLNWPYPCNW